MTAIASAFTPSEGFIIGADGRQIGRDKKIFTETSQKIFNFKSRQADTAYAWCGETGVVNQSNEVVYDLYEITRVALTSAVQVQRSQFPLFMQQCCEGIYNGIIKSPNVRQISNADSSQESIARMLLNGYFYRQPFMAEFHVRQTDRIRVHADNVSIPLTESIGYLFNGCTRRNEKYKHALPKTMPEALKLVSNYIQECIDNSDSDCFSIGGHRHIAHLSPHGFYWIDEPISPK